MKWTLIGAFMTVGGLTAGTQQTVSQAPTTTLHKVRFSTSAPGGRPEGWEELRFPKRAVTQYGLVYDSVVAATVLEANSQSSASALVRRQRIDTDEFPIVEWSWNIEKSPVKSSIDKKAGDDYPARVYLTFEPGPNENLLSKLRRRAMKTLFGEVPARAIVYLWAPNDVLGSMKPNPYSSEVMMFVVEGQGVKSGWHRERRNIIDDYWHAFHEKPPRIAGIAVMTDSDNTRETAAARYGDINFLEIR